MTDTPTTEATPSEAPTVVDHATVDDATADAVTVDESLAALEAILFLAAEPVAVEDLSLALELGTSEVERLLAELTAVLDGRGAGLAVRHAGGGWRLYTSERGRDAVERFVLAGRSGRLSQAALETLAVVAYKQPISRAEIGEVRGVNADGAVRSLAARGLVTEVGRDEGPGQAVLYGTTQDFLVKLGIDRLEDLPPLADYLIDEDAPDEPAPDQLRAARRLLQLGQRLPSTGAARWTSEDDADADGDAHDAHDEDGEDEATVQRQAAADRLRARSAQVERRRGQEEEMAGLTDRLESAASAAMDRLKDAVEAVEQDDADADPDAADDPAAAPADDQPDAVAPDESDPTTEDA